MIFIIKILLFYELISLLLLGKHAIINSESEVGKAFADGLNECHFLWSKILFTYLAASMIIPTWIYVDIVFLVKNLNR